MNRQTDQQRSTIVPVRATPTEKAVLESAAKAHGFRTLSQFTRAAWGLMLSGGSKVAKGSQG